MGTVAYKLDLLQDSKIYPVFHVSYLKKKIGDRVNPNPMLPILMENGTLSPEPKLTLERRLKKKGSRAGVDLLVQWKGSDKDDATWVDAEELRTCYAELVDELLWRGFCYKPNLS